MASKVLVKIPVAPFAHVNKSKSSEVPGTAVAEIVTVGAGTSRCTDPLLRIAQLEQNIRFLQEQHQQMLTGLHQEIEGLRQRNRDLQFQLVFSKGSIASPNSASPSSPEEDSKTRVLSPRQVNVTPLQVELLERELGELKITLHEVNTRNVYLTAIVDEQKKKLERMDTSPSPDLISKLDDVESLVRKLRRENDDLRREVSDIRSSPPGPPGGQQHSGGQHQHRGEHRGGRHRAHYRGHRFPPLQTQSYWREKEDTVLPSLNMNQNHSQVREKLERMDTSPSPDLISKLDDVESLVRKLRRENDDLRREVSDIRSSPPGPPGGQQHSGGQHQHRGEHRGGRHRAHYRGHRFPPLQTQSYWREKEDTVLPSLNMNQNHSQNQQHQQGHTSSHGGHGGHGGHYSGGKRSGNNNHHQYQQGGGGGGGGGKYRGSQSRGHKS